VTAIYGVAGNPIFGSRSPVMFNSAFRELALNATYVRLAASSAAEIMTTARDAGIEGLNITAPFKTEIMDHLDGMDGDAQDAGAVNTVVRGPAGFIGFNTDLAGVAAALDAAGFGPFGKKAVVLGAGGAGRAAALALVRAGARVVIANRTLERARDAAARIGCEAAPLDGLSRAMAGASLLVSAVSSGERVVAPALLDPHLFVLDAVYGRPTVLSVDAAKRGCTVIDGREWLLGQAAPAFGLFLKRPAPLTLMRNALWKTRRDGRRNIALIGFPASGKSAVGEELAKRSGLSFIDIDGEIERKTGASIAEIFAGKGEEAFRRMEQEEIDGIRLATRTIFACGGGALERRSNYRTLRNNCISVWLWAGLTTVMERARGQTGRPLLDGAGVEAAGDLLNRRLSGYAACADLVISTEGKGPDKCAERIWDEVNFAFND